MDDTFRLEKHFFRPKLDAVCKAQVHKVISPVRPSYRSRVPLDSTPFETFFFVQNEATGPRGVPSKGYKQIHFVAYGNA